MKYPFVSVFYLPILFMLCVSAVSFAQIAPKEEAGHSGYIRFSNGEEEAVIFEKRDLLNTPAQVLYRTSMSGQRKIGTLDDIEEFWVPGDFKYVKRAVNIDRSGDKRSNITTTRAPVFQEDTLFLQVLIEGEHSLYMYREHDLTRFFYSLDNGELRQFIHKVYLSKTSVRGQKEDELRINETYKQQVINEFRCNDIHPKLAENLQYQKRDFVRLFRKYNQCLGSSYVEWKGKKSTRHRFNLKVTPAVNTIGYRFDGVTAVTLASGNTIGIGPGLDIERISVFQFGTELELLVPVKHNRMVSAFLELNYQRHSPVVTNTRNTNEIELDFDVLTAMGGVRYYVPVTSHVSPFVEVGIGVPFLLNSGSVIRVNGLEGDIENENYQPATLAGLGVTLKDRLTLSLRRGGTSFLSTTNLEYDYFSFMLSVHVF